MLIVADENMPRAAEAFSHLGEVRLMPGRSMTPQALANAEVLLVRSITRVNRSLLEGTRVRFVGSATIGVDHVDSPYLRDAGIAFSAAPGCNANSVAEYVTAALLTLAEREAWDLAGISLGVVGVGNVGARVAEKAGALGMRVLLNDPPLQRATGDPRYLPIDALMDCDVVTFHVPLEKGGPDPTWHLGDAGLLDRMKQGATLINAARGAVVDTKALAAALECGQIGHAVLDVWEGEPKIDIDLLKRVDIGTPHIAGYSYDGKVNGTAMVYRAACAYLGVAPEWDPAVGMPAPPAPELTVDVGGKVEGASSLFHDEARRLVYVTRQNVASPFPQQIARRVVRAVYDIEADDAELRKAASLDAPQRGPYFGHLRKEYPVRREFHATAVRLHGEDVHATRKMLNGLGFR